MIKKYQTLFLEKKQITQDIGFFRFKLITPPEIEFKAGQYMILKLGDKSRLYSIFSPSYTKDYLDFMIKYVAGGKATNYFQNLKTNTQVEFEGPAGVFTLRENTKDKIFLATSSGLAPLFSMIITYFKTKNTNKKSNIYLFWGIRNYEDVCFFFDLKQLVQTYPNFHLTICLSQEQDLSKIRDEDKKFFQIGHIQDAWEKSFQSDKFNDYDYYICGSQKVVESLNLYLLQKNISKESIFFEKF